jgi:hypothetical protein
VVAHRLGVDIVTGLGVLVKNAVGNQALEILTTLCVDTIIVEIDLWGEVDFGLADVEK